MDKKTIMVDDVEYEISSLEPNPGDLCLYLGKQIWPYDYNEIWDKEKCKKLIRK